MMIAEFGAGEFQYENFDKAAWVKMRLRKLNRTSQESKYFMVQYKQGA
jgi:hypothetical protein